MLSFSMTAEPGWVIYMPDSEWGYRYGPSFITNADGSIDGWFSSPGELGPDQVVQWDWIRYKHSADGGRTWGPETVALKPTAQSNDRMSTCDPWVIKFGGYYYIGYTSIKEPENDWNHVFVARSASPTGPYEKWNGSGWGGNPAPMIRFSGPAGTFGAGEPSFVLKDGTLYIYYTWISKADVTGTPINQTRIVTAPAADPNWPGALTYHGVAINRLNANEDSTDVKYVDALGKFIAVSVCNRMTAISYVGIRESSNGLTFGLPMRLSDNIKPWCHNVGLGGTPEGHLDVKKPNILGYAYSNEGGVSWGHWSTFANPITIKPLTSSTHLLPYAQVLRDQYALCFLVTTPFWEQP